MKKRTSGFASLIILTAFLALTGCGGSEPAEPAAQVAETKAPAPAETTKPAEETPDYSAEAKKLQKQLNVLFNCDWSNEVTTETGIVRVDTCQTENILLGTGEDVALNVWADNMAEDYPTAHKVVGDGYTVITADQGQASMAWDALGAEGEVLPIK